MSSTTEASDTAYIEDGDDCVRLILPGHRKPYVAHDFTDVETRSRDNAIAEFLSKSAMRRIWNPPKKLVLEIRAKSRDPHCEAITAEAYRKLFAWRTRAAVNRFTRQLPLAVTLVAIGISVLWISNQVDEANIEENVRNTLSDVVQVGAWVALWSAISLLFATGFESLGSYIAFRRLGRIPVEFYYAADEQDQHDKVLKSA